MVQLQIKRAYGLNAVNATTELCPPNPNEFEIAGNKESPILITKLEIYKAWAILNASSTYQHSLRVVALCLPPCLNQLKDPGSTLKSRKQSCWRGEQIIIYNCVETSP